ncbi:hypothetical protein Tsp_13570, partial [Trichinella spiralis]
VNTLRYFFISYSRKRTDEILIFTVHG